VDHLFGAVFSLNFLPLDPSSRGDLLSFSLAGLLVDNGSFSYLMRRRGALDYVAALFDFC